MFPKKLMCSVEIFLSNIYYFAAIKNRKLAIRNLRLALGFEISEKQLQHIVKQSFMTMGQAVMDTIYFRKFSNDEIEKTIPIEGIENLKKALAKGKGIIVVSAHLGSFTLIGSRLSVAGYPTSMIARHMRDEKLEKEFVEICRLVGQKVIFNNPIMAFYRRCRRTLSRNELVLIMVDQNFGAEGVPVKFFNRQAMVPSGSAVLSMRTGAEIVPIFMVKNENNMNVLKIEPAINVSSTDDVEVDTKAYLQAVVDVIEKYIRDYPGQWVNWIHKRWEA